MQDGYTPTEQKLIDQGFYLYREHFMWGKTPAFRNDAGQYRFVDRDEILTPRQLYDRLKEDWCPVAFDEVNYAMNAMKHDFEALYHPSDC